MNSLVKPGVNVHAVLFVVCAVVLLLGPGNLEAQAANNLRRDAAAVAILNNAVSAMGGQESWSGVASADVSGTCDEYSPVSEFTHEPPVQSTVRWTTEGAEFRYSSTSRGVTKTYASGHGKAFLANGASISTLLPQHSKRRLPFHLPGSMLQTHLRATNRAVILIGDENVEGTLTSHIQISEFLDSAQVYVYGSQQDWWFDKQTGRPVKVSYLLPRDDSGRYQRMERIFKSWQTQHDLLVPSQMTDSINGIYRTQTCTMTSVQLNTKLAAESFDAR